MHDNQDVKEKKQSYRFDIFKGVVEADGAVRKVKSVGAAHIVEGSHTYAVFLKTFLKDLFYLMPDQKKLTDADFLIYTREPSRNPNRKYYWNQIGEGRFLTGKNNGFMKLTWDVLGCQDLYMNLYPRETKCQAQCPTQGVDVEGVAELSQVEQIKSVAK